MRLSCPYCLLERGRRHGASRGIAAVVAGLVVGCAPALDWREVSLEGSTLQARMPCRPERSERTVQLADTPSPMRLTSCTVDGVTWALLDTTVADPRRTGAALDALATTLQVHLGAAEGVRTPSAVPGMTPHERALRVESRGVYPDGRAAFVSQAVFPHGLQVFRASVTGPLDRRSDEAVDTFMASLRLNR